MSAEARVEWGCGLWVAWSWNRPFGCREGKTRGWRAQRLGKTRLPRIPPWTKILVAEQISYIEGVEKAVMVSMDDDVCRAAS